MPTVLVVEDRPIDRKFLVTLLRTAGHEVLEACDGDEALGIVSQVRPDLVFSDILMPIADGYEFVRRLREMPGLASTPVIFYTATYHEGDALALARQCGVVQVLTKPASTDALLRAVEIALSGDSMPVSEQVPPERFNKDHLHLVSSKLMARERDAEVGLQRMKAIVDVAQQLAGEHNPMRVLERVCHEVRRATMAQHGVLGLLEDDEEHVRQMFGSGFSDEEWRHYLQVSSIAGTSIEPVVRQHQSVRRKNPFGDVLGTQLHSTVGPVYSHLAVPLLVGARTYGWIGLCNKVGSDEFDDADLDLAQALATHAAIAYENAQLVEDLRRRTAALEHEVAERQQIAERLRDNEQRTLYALQASRTGIWQLDPDTERTVWSETCGPLFGLPHGHSVQSNREFMDLVYPDDRDRLNESLAHMLAGGPDMAIELRVVWPDASVHWIDSRAQMLLGSDGRHMVLGTFTDISERRLLEDQLRQAQKMEAIGQLAGGVAHDFNNLLTAILGYANLLQSEPESRGGHEEVDEIVKAAERAASLTKQLLAFSRRQVLQPQIVDLNTLVSGTTQMLRRLIGEHIHLDTSLAPDLAAVRVDPSQMVQIVMNLAVNSRDAMPSGGRLSIETRNVTLDEAFVTHHAEAAPGPYVMLVVTDTGVGMDEAVKSRLFEPFFTTKGPGQGTGLGLATVYGIVKQSRGLIWVDSEPGHGTAFRIHLPAVTEGFADREVAPEASAAISSGVETILLVEDDRAVRLLTRTILERGGYRVLEAATVEDAERLFARLHQSINLLLTDVIMPGRTGPSLYVALSKEHPELRVLFMSGYADDAMVRNGELKPGMAFLEKPFTADGLTRKVREVLDR